MNKYSSSLAMLALALTAWLCPPIAHAEEVANDQDITVQARGPVHEAYAEPVESRPQAGPAIPKQPPAPVPEEPPDQKPEGDNVQWIAGYWGWDEDRKDFTWVSGFWRVPPPDRKWVPGYWSKLEDGWQWVAGFWAPNSQESVDYLKQPPASIDNGPVTPAPDEGSTYVPGIWVYRSVRYVWRPGFWLGVRRGFLWTPAHYCYTPSGYVFQDGYWDRPLEDRGLLFAPVCFNRPLWNNPDWCFRPSYCVSVPALLSSFFVRPGYSHYYFGDYYGRDYAGRGFSPWFAYGRRYHDPLYSYYGWAHREDRGWYRGLRSDYLGRFNGELSRPPRTWGQQDTLVRNLDRHNGNFARNLNALQVVRPLRDVNNIRLSRLDRSQVANFRNVDRGYHKVSLARAGLERQGHSLVGREAPLSLRNVPRSRPQQTGLSQTSRPRGNGYGGTGNRPQRSNLGNSTGSRTFPTRPYRQGQGNFANGARPTRPSNAYRPRNGGYASRPNTPQAPRLGTPNYTNRPYSPTIRPSRPSSVSNANRPAARQQPNRNYPAYSGTRPRQSPSNAAQRPASSRPYANRPALQRPTPNFNRQAQPQGPRYQPSRPAAPRYQPARPTASHPAAPRYQPSRPAAPRYQPARPAPRPATSRPAAPRYQAPRPAPVQRAAAPRPQPRPAARPAPRPAPAPRSQPAPQPRKR